jgi:hypothetical protein
MKMSHLDIGARAQGPIVVAAAALAPGHAAGTDELVDIGPLRGTEIPMRRYAAVTLTNSSKPTIRFLHQAGVLGDHQGTGAYADYVLYDPGRDLPSYYLDWVERMPAPVTFEEFDLHRQVRASCQVRSEDPYPVKILEAVYQRLSEIGNFGYAETNGLIRLSPNTWAVVGDWLRERAGQPASNRPEDLSVTSLETFVDRLRGELLGLPRTFLDAKLPYSREAPGANARRRVMSLDEHFDAGALYAMVFAPKERRTDGLNRGLNAIARVEKIMRIHAPGEKWTAETYRTALTRYVVDRDILPRDAESTRCQTVRFWRIVMARLHRYRAQCDRSGSRGLVRLLPPRFTLPRALLNEIRDRECELVATWENNRKREAHEAFRDLDEIFDAAANRAEAMEDLGNAKRQAEATIRENDAWIDFAVTLPCLDARGHLTGRHRDERFRLWRTEEAAASVYADLDRSGLVDRARETLRSTRYDEAFVVEHLDGGADPTLATGCWMIELAGLGVLLAPNRLSPDRRDRRHDAIRSRGLPGFQAHGSAVLTFEQQRASLARFASQVGRSFVPLDEMEVAIRFADLALRVACQTYRRPHEVLQIRHDSWKPVHIAGYEDRFVSQDVMPKVTVRKDLAAMSTVSVTVSLDVTASAAEILALDRRAQYGNAPLPVAAARVSRWKCGPAPYVFSFAGRAVLPSEINLFLRYLLAGWPPFTLHDFRHAEAEDANFDGEPESKIRAGLGHSGGAPTRNYSKLPPWAEKLREESSDRRKRERLENRDAHRRLRAHAG